ncbi:MAG: HAD family hydrolase [Candidatus Zixiibacteriota bacterium]
MPEVNGKIKGVLFDMGSTLLEFENHSWEVLDGQSIAAAYNFLKKFGHNLLEFDVFEKSFRSVLAEYWKTTDRTLEEKPLMHLLELGLLRAGLERNGLNMEQLGRVFYQPIRNQITEYDDAVGVLEWLREKNLALAVVSNSIFPAEYHLEDLRTFGLAPFFKTTLFSSEIGRRKPHPEIFHRALKALSLRPEEVIFVGDRMREDVLGPQKLGIRAVLKHHPKRDYSLGANPMATVKSLRELLPVVEKHI